MTRISPMRLLAAHPAHPVFPHNGKLFRDFSTQWKTAECRAQAGKAPGEREVYSAALLRGERVSPANDAAKCFHTVENSFLLNPEPRTL